MYSSSLTKVVRSHNATFKNQFRPRPPSLIGAFKCWSRRNAWLCPYFVPGFVPLFIFFTTHTAPTIIIETKAKPPAAAPTMTPTLMESDEGAFDSCGASGEGGGLLSGAEVVERQSRHVARRLG